MSVAEVGKGCIVCEGVIKLMCSYGYDGYYGLKYAAKENDSPLVEKAIHLIDSWL